MNYSDTSWKNTLLCSGFGALRGGLVCTFTHPLDNIKYLLQCNPKHQKVRHVALELFQEEGFWGFYTGFGANLGRVMVKQFWRWPVLMGFPSYLEKKKITPLKGQLYTGLTLATLDAFGTTPLEKARIVLITSIHHNKSITTWDVMKQGWRGVTPYWLKLSANWSSFLISQRLYRSTYREYVGRQQLSIFELAFIGTAVGGTVSLFSTPFDYVNTLCQSQNKKIREVTPNFTWSLSKENLIKILRLYKGCRIQTPTMIIHNIASVILIDILSPLFFDKNP